MRDFIAEQSEEHGRAAREERAFFLDGLTVYVRVGVPISTVERLSAIRAGSSVDEDAATMARFVRDCLEPDSRAIWDQIIRRGDEVDDPAPYLELANRIDLEASPQFTAVHAHLVQMAAELEAAQADGGEPLTFDTLGVLTRYLIGVVSRRPTVEPSTSGNGAPPTPTTSTEHSESRPESADSTPFPSGSI